MSEQLELFIGHPPGDEPGKTKIADATASSSWNVNFNNGNVNTNNRQNANRVRPLAATGNIIYDILLSSIFEASEAIVPDRKERVRIVLSSIMIISPHWCGYGILLFTVNMYRTFQKYSYGLTRYIGRFLPPLSLIVLSITGSLFVSSRF